MKNNEINTSSIEYIESIAGQNLETDVVNLFDSENIYNISNNKKVKDEFIDYGKKNFSLKATSAVLSSHDAKQLRVLQLLNSYRSDGHLRANIDPLARENVNKHDVKLELSDFGLSASDLDLEFEFDAGSYRKLGRDTLRNIIKAAKNTYCNTIGAEYMHIPHIDEKRWIQERLEFNNARNEFLDGEKRWLLQRLIAAEAFESFLHTKYIGQKRFSLEGAETLIPLLNILIEQAGQNSVEKITLGMAHRGRLNVLINILGKQGEDLFKEFAGNLNIKGTQTGDVKYHSGFSSDIKTKKNDIHITLSFNPSHLEIVNPVVEGYVRYYQDFLKDKKGELVMPVLIHGDAAFAGQGVVMETLNMSQSRGYATKGTVHIVLNNQIGFTTSKQDDARSTYYCTDVAKMVNTPIFHVNAEDLEAVMYITKLAVDYRMEFGKDVVIDLVCYRRHGHNEADEPKVTQPMMYKKINSLPTTKENYAEKLLNQGIITKEQINEMTNEYRNNLSAGKVVAYNATENQKEWLVGLSWKKYENKNWFDSYNSKISVSKILELNDKLQKLPKGFKIHPRVQKVMDDRNKMARGELDIDWGFAETMAYATLADRGIPIRLSGQDCGRGTFFHRNAVLHNQDKVESYIPLQHLHEKQGKVQIIDSVLSEEAVLAFEYGYSSANPEQLVVWEAQFGDFANGAQAVIDQFIVSGETKWGKLSNLVMMLPHGLEGQGPEHSSARLERYLQACANYNIQVCVPSTASQIFHLLQRQILRKYRKPLIILTPKSLLRNPLAASPLFKFKDDVFKVVIGEQYENIDYDKVDRIVLCSGKVFYDLLTRRQNEEINNIAILRIEQLYPFSQNDLIVELAKFKNAKEIVWCQEEPINQGAWYTTRHQFISVVKEHQKLLIASRPLSSAPAEGSLGLHNKNQNILIEKALAVRPIDE